MNKFFTLLALIAISVSTSFAQISCTPDSTLLDADFPVQPLPYDPIANPQGGITDTACIGQPFEFTFFAAVGDTLNLGLSKIPLDSIRMSPVNGIGNLPAGLTFNCNPGNCVFVRNTLGCMTVSGMVTDPTLVGEYNLTLTVEAFLNSAPIPNTITLPIPTVTPGNYTLVVREADFTNCDVVSSQDILEDLVQLKNKPNPFSIETIIEMTSAISGEVNFEVFDVVGKRVHLEKAILEEGKNQISFNGSNLENGIYFYKISNHLGAVSSKMVLSK